MRAISSFSREAGISTFWCRAWSAFRTLVSMSATGSVNLIVCFSSSHPFAPQSGEPAAACFYSLCCVHLFTLSSRAAFFAAKDLYHNDSRRHHPREPRLPGRLRNPRNFPPQREPAEAQPANAKLAQKRPGPSAQLAAVVPPRGKLRLRRLGVARLLKHFLNLRVLHSFRCRHSILKFCQTNLANASSAGTA